jgi:hypothetical protein
MVAKVRVSFLPVSIGVVAAISLAGYFLWALVLHDVSLRNEWRAAASEGELLSVSAKIAKSGSPRIMDCLVDSLLRTTADPQGYIHEHLIYFCRRHWGNELARKFEVQCSHGLLVVLVEATSPTANSTRSKIRVTSGERTLYDIKRDWAY